MKARTRRSNFNRRSKQRGVTLAAIPWIIAATAAAGAVGSAVMQHNAGVATKNNAIFQARIEGDAAKQQEITRRQNLLRALSSQNAAAGAGGVETSGSVGAGMRRQINQNNNDLLVVDANASSRQSMLQSQASNAVRAGNMGAAVSLLDGGVKTYNAIPA